MSRRIVHALSVPSHAVVLTKEGSSRRSLGVGGSLVTRHWSLAAILAAFLLASVPGLVSAQVVQVTSSSSTTTTSAPNGLGWGAGGKPKPTPTPALDPDGTWTRNANGNWSTTTNWLGGIVADGGGFANFSTLDITSTVNVTIDNTSRTIGRLDIGDTNSSNSYIIKNSGGASLIFDNTANSANAQLNETLNSNGDTISAPIVLNSSLDITNVSSPAATLTLSGAITAGTAGTKTITTSSGLVTITGDIGNGSGTVAIVQNGPGTLILGGTNTFTGSVAVNGGTLQMGSGTALNSSNVVSVAAGATFDIHGFDETIAGLNGGTGTVTNNGGAQTLTLAGTGTYTFGGVLTAHDANHNDLNLVKSGSGTQTLTGASLYNGGTTISAGTLFANNTTGSATGAGNVTVNSGGTLGGTGTIAPVGGNKVDVKSGGILEGGTGSTGQTLTIAGNLTLESGSIIELALGPGLTHSTLARTSGTWSFAPTQKFTFLLAPGTTTGTYEGIITGLAVDPGTESTWTITNPGFIATFFYDAGDIDLNVTAIPEPSTYAAAALACLTVAYTLRRRILRMRVIR
jgi:autotransporter-associated beta strand protein